MAKENEKKVSGEMNSEELENVAGGGSGCYYNGINVPAEVEGFRTARTDSTHTVIQQLENGYEIHSVFDSITGNCIKSDVVRPRSK